MIDVETLISKKIPMFGYQLISKKDVKEDNPLQKNVYEEEQNKKSFFGNALKRVKTFGQKVSEKIDQMKEKKTKRKTSYNFQTTHSANWKLAKSTSPSWIRKRFIPRSTRGRWLGE